MVHSGSNARLVDLFVDALPLSNLGFTRAQHESQGRPPYHLGVLLKLYMFGYRHGLRSSFMHHHYKRTIYLKGHPPRGVGEQGKARARKPRLL